MGFVNEYVPETDINQYGLEEINQKYRKANIPGDYRWTVDRERDIYLRWINTDWRSDFQQVFSFYWKGVLIEACLIMSSAEILNAYTWTLHYLSVPDVLKRQKYEILEDLKEALEAYVSGNAEQVIQNIFKF